MLLEFAGRAALILLEDAVERGNALEAGLHGNGRDGLIGVCQEILGTF